MEEATILIILVFIAIVGIIVSYNDKRDKKHEVDMELAKHGVTRDTVNTKRVRNKSTQTKKQPDEKKKKTVSGIYCFLQSGKLMTKSYCKIRD